MLITVVHLTVMDRLHDRVWQSYFDGIAVRLGSAVSAMQKVGPRDVALAMWHKRGNLVPGGTGPSTWFLGGGIAGWIVAGVGLPLVLRRRRDARLPADLMVLAVAAGGIVAWCLLFPNHTFVHNGFTVRYLTLPAAYGGVAAAQVVTASMRKRPAYGAASRDARSRVAG